MSYGLVEQENRRVLDVQELNAAVKQLVENGLPLVWVRGEVSNFVSAASGHWYFSLKDDRAQVRCVMFRHKNQYVEEVPRNGMEVEVQALATLYEARGDFQLTLERMRPAGLGRLYEAFERLKRKLAAEGLFDEGRKRPLPFFPGRIGVITSPRAAALRDVLTTLARRMPSIPVVLYPAPVQGAGAGQKIAEAIALANHRAECDVLLLCRGGGSIEDLWAYNEEVVARAIAASHLPVVSGVGHETDFTIADFVADRRAATPTAAAQLAVPDGPELRGRMAHHQARLQHSLQRRLEGWMQRLDYLQRRLVHPALKMRHQAQHLEQLQRRLQQARPDVARLQGRLFEVRHRMQKATGRVMERQEMRLQGYRQQLSHLDPQRVLARGYSMVRDEQGAIVRDASTLRKGERLDISFAQGWALAELKETGDKR